MSGSSPVATSPNAGRSALLDALLPLVTSIRNTGSFGGSGEGPDIYERVIGLDASGLANLGQEFYPDIPAGSRHHATAANLLTSRLGAGGVTPGSSVIAVLLPQLLGLGVEAGEAMVTGGRTLTEGREDTLADLLANLRGSLDAVP